MPAPGNEESRAAKEGYYKAATTLICQSCSKIRRIENIVQIKPRIKCRECVERSAEIRKRLGR